MQDVKRIESYGLYDFCQDLEAAFKEGYVFDFDTNENFPTAYGTMFTCGLVKDTAEVETTKVETGIETKTEETVTETTQVSESVAVTEQTEEVVQDTEQATEVETEETAEVKEPAKRGPKPKNK